MIDYNCLYELLRFTPAAAWAQTLPQQIDKALNINRHGSLPEWQQILASLPDLSTNTRIIDSDILQIGSSEDLDDQERTQLEASLKSLHPWRKGPFDLFGIKIDAEWRSDWKWRRVEQHITPLKHRSVLDVGCGNGYYCWRMLGAGAKFVIGIDPMLLNVIQFQLIRKLYGDNPPVYVLPLGVENLPYGMKAFDTIFSMGVFYHRRSPIDHLLELRDLLTPGGELILETLVIDGGLGEVLVPQDRYAKMRNIWFLPSCPTLISWFLRCGFINIRLVDITATSTDEQRRTDWMTFHSLKDHLDPSNVNLTCEGLPAPKRAIFIVQSPST